MFAETSIAILFASHTISDENPTGFTIKLIKSISILGLHTNKGKVIRQTLAMVNCTFVRVRTRNIFSHLCFNKCQVT